MGYGSFFGIDEIYDLEHNITKEEELGVESIEVWVFWWHPLNIPSRKIDILQVESHLFCDNPFIPLTPTTIWK